MKATDLMIGDYIQDLAGDLCQVIVLDRQVAQVETLTGVHQGDTTRYLHEAEGVPLTPEILEKNGIKLSYTYTHPYRDSGWEEGELEEAMKHYPMYVYQTLNPYITFVIRPNEQELKVCSSNHKTIVEKKEKVLFVHELQHALRLCGIDKDIVL